MNTEEQREVLQFILESIEIMSLSIMTGDYEFSEMNLIHSEAQVYLGYLENMRLEQVAKE